MIDVQFDNDPAAEVGGMSYIDTQKHIFIKPSTSPIVSSLISSGFIKTENKGGVAIAVIFALLMVTAGYFFYKYGLETPEIDTKRNFRPAMSQEISNSHFL